MSPVRWAMAAGLSLLVAACSSSDPTTPDKIEPVRGYAGLIASDEPRATLVGRDVLVAGGLAADAVVAMAFAMTATLPSRVGLASGGACLAYKQGGDKVDLIDFPLRAEPALGTSRPLMARAMALLHARHGLMRWEQVVGPAESLAQVGFPIARAFAADRLAALQGEGPAADYAASLVGNDGRPLAEGAQIYWPELGSMLSGIRQAGAGYLYSGPGARRWTAAEQSLGHALDREELAGSLPVLAEPASYPTGIHILAVAAKDALPAASDLEGALVAAEAAPAGPAGGATAKLAAGDSFGNVAVCALTLGGLFGGGAVLPGTGSLTAAPAEAGPYALALLWNEPTKRPHMAAAASGQGALARLLGEAEKANAQDPREVALDNGVTGLWCARSLQRDARECDAAPAEPRHGLGVIAQ